MIRLQFSAMDDPASEAIKLFERGWPSHVDALLDDGTLLGARSDSVGGKSPGVQIRPSWYAAFSHVEVVMLGATILQREAWLNFLLAQVGKPYDILAIVAFTMGRDWRQPDSWFCSELQAAALESCGWFPRPLANAANEITPRDLLLAVSPWAQR